MHRGCAQSFLLLVPLFYQIGLNVTLKILTTVKYLASHFINVFIKYPYYSYLYYCESVFISGKKIQRKVMGPHSSSGALLSIEVI